MRFQFLRCVMVAVVLSASLSAQTRLRGSRRMDDKDGGFNEGSEIHPDQEIPLDQEGSLDQIEKMEFLIHSEKVNKLLEKAKAEVQAYSKDFAQESALDRLEKVIEGEKNSPDESAEDAKTLGQLENLITREIQSKKNKALATTTSGERGTPSEEEEDASLDNLESLLKKEETRIQREEESFSGKTKSVDLEQDLFNGKTKNNVVTPIEELDSDKASVEEEDSSSGGFPTPETDRENINLEEHVEENQYKWLKKKLGKKSRGKKLNGDEADEHFDSGSDIELDEMQSGSHGKDNKKKKKKRKSRSKM